MVYVQCGPVCIGCFACVVALVICRLLGDNCRLQVQVGIVAGNANRNKFLAFIYCNV